MLMDDALLEKFIKDYIDAQSMPEVLFTWHGGEPMLRGLDFYKKVLRLQQKYGHGRKIDNALQTNGTLMTREWAQFLHDNGFLVGVSIDGPEEIHNKYRQRFDKVMECIALLKEYDVMWNAMAVVTADSAKNPVGVYRFLRQLDARFMQFSPLVYNPQCSNMEHVAPYTKDAALTGEMWGDFLCGVFDEWVKEDVGDYYVEIFDATLSNMLGVTPGTCCFSPTCGQVGAMEYNGDVYSCDHFVAPEFKLGNIKNNTFIEMMYGEKQSQFGEAKRTALPTKCKRCCYVSLCYGECPKNRYTVTTEAGEAGENILCAGYYRYFQHTEPFMREMEAILRRGQ